MSSFIVEDRTINEIVSYLYRHDVHRMGKLDTRPFEKIGYLFGDQLMESEVAGGLSWYQAVIARREKLAQDLFDLNCRAVDIRYEDRPARSEDGFHPDPFGYKEVKPPAALAFIKHLQCLRYQCAEGDIPETDLFKAITDSIDKACEAYIYNLPEYDALPWG